MKLRYLTGAVVLAAVAACSTDPTSPALVERAPALRPSALLADAPMSGAIFTTNASCDGTNVNIFGSQDKVYLDGGPTHLGAAGLPNGPYYVQVTTPEGILLGSTPTASVTVAGGEFTQCYQLSVILVKASDPSVAGYDPTTNGGGEYKVWVSRDPTFPASATKTDNFKVNSTGGGDQGDPEQGRLNVVKYYDLNANGQKDASDPLINGWQVRIQDGVDFYRFTPVSMVLAPDVYTVTESAPIEANWYHTTLNPVTVPLANAQTRTVEFGNVCVGAGGGLTLGFWSNKNGQALFGNADQAMLVALNLRNANGTSFDPGNYSAFRTWLLNAAATNMAYMLSAQLAAMELNVYNGKVPGGSLIYAPGTSSANSNGFATVDAVMAEANSSLGANGYTVAADATRDYQEALKNALDRANNNLSFVQAAPCPFSFATTL